MPEFFAPILERLEPDAMTYFGAATLRLVPEEYEERPFSHLLRLGVITTGVDGQRPRLFVKVYKPKNIEGGPGAMQKRVAADYETNRRVHAAMLSYDDLGAVPTVACYPEWLTIVTEEVQGPTLLALLKDHARWFPSEDRLQELRETLTRVGRWIRTFQATDSGSGHKTIDHLREYIDNRLRRLAGHAGARFSESDRKQVLRHVDLLGRRITPEELHEVAVHSDLALGNVLVSGRRIVVLDFAMAKLGNSLHDLARMFVQLDILAIKPQLRTGVIRELQRSLLEGFDPSLKPDRPLFRLLLLLHRVNHLASLSINRAPLAEALYNGLVRHRHRRWIASEIAGGGEVGEWK